MGGWVDGWTDEWLDGWVTGWVNGVDAWMDGWICAWGNIPVMVEEVGVLSTEALAGQLAQSGQIDYLDHFERCGWRLKIARVLCVSLCFLGGMCVCVRVGGI